MNFTIIDAEQRSHEWFAARCGRLTGSRAADMLATIKKGEALMVSYGAISRDRAEHGEDPHPDTFDLTRTKGRHLSFGHGPHVCPGSHLARMEGEIALPMLFERFPDLRLAVSEDELENHPSVLVNSIKELPILLRP